MTFETINQTIEDTLKERSSRLVTFEMVTMTMEITMTMTLKEQPQRVTLETCDFETLIAF